MSEEWISFGREETQRALDRLWLIFKNHGYGTIARVERELGLPPKTLALWRSRQQLRYSDLMAILRTLGENPSSFLLGLFPQGRSSTTKEGINNTLADIVWRSEDLVYEDPLLCLRLLSEALDDRWETSLAIAKSLKALELWRESEVWIRKSIEKAPTASERSICRLLLVPILALPRNTPGAAIKLVEQCRPFLEGSHLALSYQYESLALRAGGDLSSAARAASLALLEPRVSGPTRAGAFQALGLILKDAGDRLAAVACFRKAHNVFAGTYTRGHSLWALAQALDGNWSRKLYTEALATFRSSFPFESFTKEEPGYPTRTTHFGLETLGVS